VRNPRGKKHPLSRVARQVLGWLAAGQNPREEWPAGKGQGPLSAVLRVLMERGYVEGGARTLTAAGLRLANRWGMKVQPTLWGKPLSWFRPEGGAS